MIEQQTVERWPFVYAFLEVREWGPSVKVLCGEGETCTTEYPESRGVLNSYSDSCSD